MSTRSCGDPIKLGAMQEQENCEREREGIASSPNNMSQHDGHAGRTEIDDRACEHEIRWRIYRTQCNLGAGKLRA